jgi:hypothetical protein
VAGVTAPWLTVLGEVLAELVATVFSATGWTWVLVVLLDCVVAGWVVVPWRP